MSAEAALGMALLGALALFATVAVVACIFVGDDYEEAEEWQRMNGGRNDGRN